MGPRTESPWRLCQCIFPLTRQLSAPLIQFIRDIFETGQVTRRPIVSFEFFPTKSEEGERVLLEKTIPALRELNPDFCSVTYGAGGGTREQTLAIVDRIQQSTDEHTSA